VPQHVVHFLLECVVVQTIHIQEGNAYFQNIDRLKGEIVHILDIPVIMVVTQNHGIHQKSRHNAKITVTMEIVNL